MRISFFGGIWRLICRMNHTQTTSSTPSNRVKARSIFAEKNNSPMENLSHSTLVGVSSLIFGSSIIYILYQNNFLQPLPPTRLRDDICQDRQRKQDLSQEQNETATQNLQNPNPLLHQNDSFSVTSAEDESSWAVFTKKFATFSTMTNLHWISVANTVADYVLPEWAKSLPENINKLQKELLMARGSLADEIWQEAHDPKINPEIECSADVRVSTELCDEEKNFIKQRMIFTAKALAKYLEIPEEEIHPDDVPKIAMVGSGGGLRALVSVTGSMLASEQDGLFDCITYTAGVSGSCWLQALFNSSLGSQKFENIISHLKSRIDTHIAYPPDALAALNSPPTNKYLLCGLIEKLMSDPESDFGLVDVYGLLISARLLIPEGEMDAKDEDLKISNQRKYIEHGQNPMPIYTAVRHEIPLSEESGSNEKCTDNPSEESKAKAKREAWFQWFEISPYEMFCEEFSAGIPTWAIGRKFEGGNSIPYDENGLYIPELRLPLLLGIFGSAFCATLSHYYKEIRPFLRGFTGFDSVDELIGDRNEHLSKVHPINPASIPNFIHKMDGDLPRTVPGELCEVGHLQLMDAGMSNNLPIYPLLRPGRDIDILIAFDASADIKTENWLSVADGYALQRGIKGWPAGAGWPKAQDSDEITAMQLEKAQASTEVEAEAKLEDAQLKRPLNNLESQEQQVSDSKSEYDKADLGYCNVWVGRTQERSSSTDQVKSKVVQEDWELMQPDAGIAVIYFPFISNPKFENVDPETSEYMSTWNFVYTAENIDNVVALARANFDEGKEKTKRYIRAVYERKKKIRMDIENKIRGERKMRLEALEKNGEETTSTSPEPND